MNKKAFIMTKLPHAGMNKRRLLKDIGDTKIKRLILNNIENGKRIFLHRKNVELYYYLSKKENFWYKQIIGKIYTFLNSLLSEIHMTEFLSEERAEKFRIQYRN